MGGLWLIHPHTLAVNAKASYIINVLYSTRGCHILFSDKCRKPITFRIYYEHHLRNFIFKCKYDLSHLYVSVQSKPPINTVIERWSPVEYRYEHVIIKYSSNNKNCFIFD